MFYLAPGDGEDFPWWLPTMDSVTAALFQETSNRYLGTHRAKASVCVLLFPGVSRGGLSCGVWQNETTSPISSVVYSDSVTTFALHQFFHCHHCTITAIVCMGVTSISTPESDSGWKSVMHRKLRESKPSRFLSRNKPYSLGQFTCSVCCLFWANLAFELPGKSSSRSQSTGNFA